MSNMTQAWLSARDRPRQTHLSAHPAPFDQAAALPLPSQAWALSVPPQPTTHRQEMILWQNILLLPPPWWMAGGYEGRSRVCHSIFSNSAMASSTFLSSVSVCWSWG